MNAREASHQPGRLESLEFTNSFAGLPDAFYTRLDPLGLPEPYMVCASRDVAELIGLDPGEMQRPEFTEIFAGNVLPPGSDALAAVYSGHPLGICAWHLDDGPSPFPVGLRRPPHQ